MPTSQEISRYVGLPYDAETFDCADLTVKIQRELFGRSIVLPRRPKGARTVNAFISRKAEELATPVALADAADGDGVIMCENGAPSHIGTLFFVSGMPWVLHASASVGYSVLQRFSELAGYGLKVEGVYRWK